MACGAPCVATPLALQGIGAVPGTQVLVGADAPELAAEVDRVLADDALARRLGAAGRAYVCSQHDWGTVARSYVTVWEQARGTTPRADGS